MVANFGSKAVTDLNQSVSNSTALAKDLNSETPLRILGSQLCLPSDIIDAANAKATEDRSQQPGLSHGLQVGLRLHTYLLSVREQMMAN